MYEDIRLPILEFIVKFKKGFDVAELERVFTQGNCYHFAIILKYIYTEGYIVYSNLLGHFLFEYEDEYYDITGKVFITDDSIIKMENLLLFDPLLYNQLKRDCLFKVDYYPYGRRGEDINATDK